MIVGMEISSDIFHIFLVIYYFFDYGQAASHDQHTRRMKKKSRKWTIDQENDLIFFDVSTDTGESNHFERIKSKWREEYPHSNVTDEGLRKKLRKLREESLEEGELKKNYKWSRELEQELLDVYHNTSPYKSNASITLGEEWKRRHPDYRASTKCLFWRLQKLSKENKYPEYGPKESSVTNFQSNNQHDPELIHAYNIAVQEGGYILRKAHEIWSGFHPQYRHVTLQQLKKRVDYLNKNPPDDDFPWTREENQELLEIYDETMPEKEDQGQRIYDIWSKRHPRYSFMTPYYLQIHASTLAHKRQIKEAGKILNAKWTNEEKTDLINMVHRYPRNNRNEWLAFHMEWVRKHPRLAYKTNKNLLFLAKRFKSQGLATSSLETGEGSQTGFPELKTRNKNEYTPEMKQELLNLFNQTNPGNRGHAIRLKEKWDEKHEDLFSIKAQSLKRLVRNWAERGPDKRPDKAPIVYSSDEAGSSST